MTSYRIEKLPKDVSMKIFAIIIIRNNSEYIKANIFICFFLSLLIFFNDF